MLLTKTNENNLKGLDEIIPIPSGFRNTSDKTKVKTIFFKKMMITLL